MTDGNRAGRNRYFLGACLAFFVSYNIGARGAAAPLSAPPALTIGFEQVDVPRPGASPLKGAFWYPSTSPAALLAIGLNQQSVAVNGTIAGDNHPLVVISHGALGNWRGHADTAAALARAGFVVAAVTHDEVGPSGVLMLAKQSQQLSQLIDFAEQGWRGHSSVNKAEIGVFGFSVGGFAALVAAGGKPEASRIGPHCKVAPMEWSCELAAQHRLDVANVPPPPAGVWLADPRIKAAVIAAPALGYVFGTPGLAGVRIPVQLWQAGNDRTLAEPWNAEAVRQDLPHSPDYHLVPGADHGDFGAPCVPSAPATNVFCHNASGFDRAVFHVSFNAAVVAFFSHWLRPARP